MLAAAIVLSFGSLVASFPFDLPNVNLPVHGLARRHGNTGFILASDCGSPCEIYFSTFSTTLTVSVSPQTMTVAGAVNPVTVTFTPITTTTTIQPSAQTVDNSYPKATPTIDIMDIEMELEPITVDGSSIEDVEMEDGTQIEYTVTSQVQLVAGPDQRVTYSRMNPYNLGNNCAFITMSKLMDMDLQSFLTMIDEMQELNSGLSSAHVKAILQRIPRETYFEEVTFGDTLQDISDRMMNPDQLGVCYLRDDNSGHCVVYRNGKFYDYQESDAPIGEVDDGDEDIASMIQPRVVAGGRTTGFVFAIGEE